MTLSSNVPVLLDIYYMTSDSAYLPEANLFNYTRSIITAVKYVRSLALENGSNYFWARLIPKPLPGCTMQTSSRAAKIFQLLQYIKKNASKFHGFSVLIGPPIPDDCHLVNQWIITGTPNETQSQQIYQINYCCQDYDGVSEFVSQVSDNIDIRTYPPIAAVSLAIPRMTHFQGLKSIADMLKMPPHYPTVLQSDLDLVFYDLNLYAGVNITKSLFLFQNNLDVLLIFARPSTAVKLVIHIQNLAKIKEGRIAIIHVDMMDLLTYDVLTAWKSALTECGPTLSAGRSLMIFTALPTGTVYRENYSLYGEDINLSVAHAAALAFRMAQLNVEKGGGNISSKTGLFTPLRTNNKFIVPTLPNINFTYTTEDGNNIKGLFDMFIFTLKPSVTERKGSFLRSTRYGDVFQLVDVIKHPLILIRMKNPMNWPGDGKGPHKTKCLDSTWLDDRIWLAPELLRNENNVENYSRPGDVYAFAIIMHTVFYQCKPFGIEEITPDIIVSRVKACETPPFRPRFCERDVPSAYCNILESSWLENPTLRPTFGELTDQIERMTMGKKINIVEHMTKMTEKYSTGLEETVQKRLEELENEKRRKELLTHRMLPPVVVESLKAGIAVAPEIFDEVSIYFSDIVGFTTISAMSTPLQVVDFLNDLYTIFDQTIANYDVYKVETIGDAYMVASGLPVRNGRRHAGEVAMTALELLCACGNFTIKHLSHVPLRLRIGLHTGRCVAGVVGLTMPRYCLFGDTVHRALKMESSGAGDQQTKEVLDDIGGYYTEYRGPIEFEGGIKTATYWLTGIHSVTNFKIDFKMNEDESCKQLMRKLGTLSSDSDSQATKSILKLIQKLQNLIPEFVIPGDFELIKQDAALSKGTKRKTRASRQSTRTSALPKKSKRRKISNSHVLSDSDCAQSTVTTVSEMHTIPEEVSGPSASQALNATYLRPTSDKFKSASKRVGHQEDAQNTLLANTAKSIHLTPQPVTEKTVTTKSGDVQSPPPAKKGCFQSSQSQNSKPQSVRKSSLKESSVPVESSPQLESADLEKLSNNADNSHIRSSSRQKHESLLKVSKVDVQSVAEPVSQSQSGSLGKLFKMDTQSVAESMSQKPIDSLTKSSNNGKSSHVETSSQQESGFVGEASKTSKDLKSPEMNTETLISATNETPQTVEVTTEQLKGTSNRGIASSEIMTEDEEEEVVVQKQRQVPAETPVDVPTSSADVPSQGDATATSNTVSSNRPPFVKSIFPFVASTPSVPQQHGTPWSASKSNWLSRLGWMNVSKTTAPTPSMSTQVAPPTTSFQSQTVKVMGKTKNNTSTNVVAPKVSSNFGGGIKSSKPVSSSNFSLGSNQRPPTISRFNNNLPATIKTNCSTIAEKSFGGGAIVHRASTAIHGNATTTTVGRLGKAGTSIFSAKDQAEQERRERLLAEMAEKEERQREAQERKALEHKAKVKAANERRAALLAAKEKPPPFNQPKSAIQHSAAAPSTSQVMKQAFGTNSTNLPAATTSSHTTAHHPSTSTTYMKNFDFVKVPPPPLPQVNHLKTHPLTASETPISYDLTGILDEYTSDSEDENRAKKRPIPSWARSDSQFLIEMVSKAYRGELRWQNIFRPAELVHFDDADLFHGYKFRTRKRGSSAVWISPSKQPHQQHSVASKSSLKSSTAT
ncbi:unnamed protein product [Hymenolepis diminuta]|uniref:Guanylate cyclase domain-containing protein n=1 Tax=Hymenolepis diminuta TaxID=6216 RepID=A0A3P7BHV6_HYMDI|nr:unnamed protein product [Hymenolepis diminuta]